MKKIKEFISNNNKELQVLAYGTMMLAIGINFGIKYGCGKMDQELISLGDKGKKLYKAVGDKLYTLSVTKEQL